MTGGWHPDPLQRHQQRWWDGVAWTEHVADSGVVGVDPLDASAPHHEAGVFAPPTVVASQARPAAGPPAAGPPAAGPPAAGPPAAGPPAVTPPVVAGGAAPVVAASAGGAPNRRRTALVVGGIAAVAAVVLAVVLTRGGDDESVAPSDDTEDTTEITTDVTTATTPVATTVVETTVPATTVPVTTEPATTLPPTLPSTVPPTAPPTAPPPSIVVASESALLGVLPTAEIPGDWVAPPQGATWTGGEPEVGPYVGMCSGDNDSSRAVAAGVRAIAGAGWYDLPSGGWYEMRTYGFPTPADAASFMNMTRLQATACPAGNTYQLPEGPNDGQFDGFSDGDPPVVWNMSEQIYEADVTVAGVDETIQIVWITSFSTTEDRVAYSGVETTAYQYERFGAVVVVHVIDSWHDFVGFGSGGGTYVADPVDVIGIAEAFRPGLVQRMRGASLI